MNEILLDEKDLEIRKLKNIIDGYKKYDKKRMSYMQNLINENRNLQFKYNDLKSLVGELDYDDFNIEDKLKIKNSLLSQIKNLEERVTELNKFIKSSKGSVSELSIYTDDELNKIAKAFQMNILKECADLRKKNKKLNELNASLIYNNNKK